MTSLQLTAACLARLFATAVISPFVPYTEGNLSSDIWKGWRTYLQGGEPVGTVQYGLGAGVPLSTPQGTSIPMCVGPLPSSSIRLQIRVESQPTN